jgi:hypothetical protein
MSRRANVLVKVCGIQSIASQVVIYMYFADIDIAIRHHEARIINDEGGDFDPLNIFPEHAPKSRGAKPGSPHVVCFHGKAAGLSES